MNMRCEMQGETAQSSLNDRLDELTRLVRKMMGPAGEQETAAPIEGRQIATAAGTRSTKPPAPDPRLLRRIIRHRQDRRRFFDPSLFADPAWDMLLDLTASREEHRRVSVTSLCIASGVPPTTALRWISQMVDQGIFVRMNDIADRRRAFIELTDASATAMARYFAETDVEAHR